MEKDKGGSCQFHLSELLKDILDQMILSLRKKNNSDCPVITHINACFSYCKEFNCVWPLATLILGMPLFLFFNALLFTV